MGEWAWRCNEMFLWINPLNLFVSFICAAHRLIKPRTLLFGRTGTTHVVQWIWVNWHFTLTTRKAQTTVIIIIVVVRFAAMFTFTVQFIHASLIIIEILQIPHRRPSILPQIVLVLGMQRSQAFRQRFANDIVVDAQKRHTPFGQLMGIVQLRRARMIRTNGGRLPIEAERAQFGEVKVRTLTGSRKCKQSRTVSIVSLCATLVKSSMARHSIKLIKRGKQRRFASSSKFKHLLVVIFGISSVYK